MTAFELALVLSSALLHAWWSASIKASGDPLVFNLLQGGVTLVLAAAVLPLIHWGEIPPAAWRWLAVTSVAHTLYIFWFSQAFAHGDLTLVYPIARSTPAFLPLLAVPLFGESVSPGGALGIGVVVAGLWLVHAGQGWSAAAFASPAARYAYLTLAATVAYGLADKGAMAALAGAPWSSPVPRALAYYTLLALACNLLFAPLVLAARGPRAIVAGARSSFGAASLASAASAVGYGLILKALETAPASYVVAARQTSVMFALVLGTIQLRERPGRARIVGALATVAGVAMIALLGS